MKVPKGDLKESVVALLPPDFCKRGQNKLKL